MVAAFLDARLLDGYRRNGARHHGGHRAQHGDRDTARRRAVPVDLKQKSDSGATLLRHVQLLNGQRNYTVSIAEGEARDEFTCAEVDATTMDCSWAHITPTDEINNGPFRLMKH